MMEPPSLHMPAPWLWLRASARMHLEPASPVLGLNPSSVLLGLNGLEPLPPQGAVALSHLSYSPVITGACVASASISAYTRMPPAHTVGYRCGRFTGL